MMTIFLSSIGMKTQTLGIDRMVLAAGATLQFPGMNRLVMLELVSHLILSTRVTNTLRRNRPGLQLRYKSLHDFTAKLPLLSLES
jgi:type III pantothenate kinase